MTPHLEPIRKVAVCTPWHSPFMWTEYVDATLNLRHPEGAEVRFFRGRGWCPAKRHINMCYQAVNWGADLICIIGADQVHPEDMLVRLVNRWKEGYDAIACLVPCRGFVSWQDMKPFQPMAWRFKANAEGCTDYRVFRGVDKDSDLVEVIRRDMGGMQRCNFIGSGVIMFHRDHLLSISEPWFRENVIDEKTQDRVANMDCTFSWRLQAEGEARLWVDTTIEVKHLNTFMIDDTFQERFSDWSRPNVGDQSLCKFVQKTESPVAGPACGGGSEVSATPPSTPLPEEAPCTT